MKTSSLLKKVLTKLAASRINWVKPKFVKEICSYYEEPETISFLKKQGILFSDDKELLSFLNKGKFEKISDEELLKKGKNITVKIDEFEEEIKNQNYLPSYKHLENSLIEKDLNLECPILIKFKDGTYWGFSGNRRANLARKNKLPLLFWVIDHERVLQDEKDKEKREAENEERLKNL